MPVRFVLVEQVLLCKKRDCGASFLMFVGGPAALRGDALAQSLRFMFLVSSEVRVRSAEHQLAVCEADATSGD